MHPNRKSLADWPANLPGDERQVFWNEPRKAVVPARPQPGALRA